MKNQAKPLILLHLKIYIKNLFGVHLYKIFRNE